MSDYDILIVTRRRLGLKEYDVYARITERFFENKQSEFYTRPQFINESISRLNKNLELGQYFYHEIKKQGIMLYSSQEFKLARCRKLNYAEIAKIARDYFNEKFQFASDFLLEHATMPGCRNIKWPLSIYIKLRKITCVPFRWYISFTAIKIMRWKF